MGLKASDSGGGNFRPVPPGSYVARCISVIDLGTQVSNGKFGEKAAHKARLSWEVFGDDDDGQRCEINGLTMIYQVGEAEYPTEWQHGKDGQPCCTAFIPAGDPIPTPRCTKTLELF